MNQHSSDVLGHRHLEQPSPHCAHESQTCTRLYAAMLHLGTPNEQATYTILGLELGTLLSRTMSLRQEIAASWLLACF